MPLREVTLPNEIEVSNPPDVKIIQNGKLVDTSAIDDYDGFMTYLMTASIAANTVKIRRLQEDRTSKGRASYFPLDITQTLEEIPCPYPLQSLYIENNGPGQIFVFINALGGTAIPIPANREVYIPFETHVIERFYVRSTPGTVATGRAIGKY